jgi:hypothetical protein
MDEKPGRIDGFDPVKAKARDNARQRKIVSNSSDKASRKNAPLIKARTHRVVRRIDREALVNADAEAVPPADAERVKDRAKHQLWGSFNAAERREWRAAERMLLDKTAGTGPKGRRRSSEQNLRPDASDKQES